MIESSADAPPSATDPASTITEAGVAPTPFDRDDCLRPGDTIGRYCILHAVGRGGMGVVYAAYDPQLERRVAVKILHSARERSPGFRTRLLREARAMARLSHPNVVTVHEAAVDDGRVYISMEFVSGKTVNAWLRAQKRTWRETIEVFRQAALGLAAAHAAGLVHRDVKPENIMLGDDGRARLTDFGIAREAPSSTGSGTPGHPSDVNVRASEHRTRGILGTPAYMSPEQLRGEEVDAASDQFSLCVTLFEALYGDRPFVGRTPRQLQDAIANGSVAPPSADAGVPRWLHQLVMRGLSAHPAERWPSLDAFVRRIEGGRSGIRPAWRVAAVVIPVSIIGGIAIGGGFGGDPCEGRGGAAPFWSDADRKAVADGLKSTAKAFAESTAVTVAEMIDAYASAWAEQNLDACEAHAAGKQSDTLFDRRQACLRARGRAVESLVDVLAVADLATAQRAVHAADSLPRLEDCAAYRLSDDGRWTLPDDPGKRREHEAVIDKLTNARTLYRSGHYEPGRATAEAAVAQAKALGSDALLSEALLVRHEHELRLDDLEQARASAQDAWRVALRSGSTAAAARAGSALISVVGYRLREEAPAEQRVGDVESLLARLKTTNPEVASELEAAFLQARGLVAWRFQRREEAVEILGRALELVRSDPHSTPLQIANYLNSLGMAHLENSDYERALEDFEEALRLKVEVLGENHPDVGNLHNNIGLQLKQLQRYDESRTHLELALELSTAAFGPDHSSVHMAELNLGTLHDKLGNHEMAVAFWERSMGTIVALEGEPPILANRTIRYARVLGMIGRREDALTNAEAVLAYAVEHADPTLEARAKKVLAEIRASSKR